MTSGGLYSAHYHRRHHTLQAFEQFGALYMYSHDVKYQSRPRLEPGTSRLQAPVNTNEPSEPAIYHNIINSIGHTNLSFSPTRRPQLPLVQWIRCSPRGSHLIHWTSAVFSHIVLKWTPFAYHILLSLIGHTNLMFFLTCRPQLPRVFYVCPRLGPGPGPGVCSSGSASQSDSHH